MNAIRLPIGKDNYSKLRENDAWNEMAWGIYFNKIDEYLDLGKKHGIGFIIDLHNFPGELNLTKNSENEAEFIDFWRRIATRYKDRGPEVIGYDLLNAPHPDINKYDWNVLVEKTVAAIRSVDTAHYIIVKTAHYADPPYFQYLTPLDDGKILYSYFHYEPHSFTEGLGEGNYPGWISNEETGTYWDKDRLESRIAAVVEWQNTNQRPIYVGEFGISERQNGADQYVRDSLSLFEKYNFSWTFWHYKDYNSDWSIYYYRPGEKWQVRETVLEMLKDYVSKYNADTLPPRAPTGLTVR